VDKAHRIRSKVLAVRGEWQNFLKYSDSHVQQTAIGVLAECLLHTYIENAIQYATRSSCSWLLCLSSFVHSLLLQIL